jgi:S1-C subfamily serine protease
VPDVASAEERGVAPTETRNVSELRADSAALIEVAGRVLPAVVSVASTRLVRVDTSETPLDAPFWRRFFGPSSPLPLPFLPPGQVPESRGLGSGVIVDKDLILTNAHVIEGAQDIEVTAADRRTIQTKLVGSDPKSDLAVLRITGDTSQLKMLEFADSSKAQVLPPRAASDAET